MSADRHRGPSASGPLSVDETIHRYHEVLVNFLRQRLRRHEDAADIAQETYMRLMQYEGARDIRSTPSLLFRIAANIVNDRIRAARTRHVGEHCSIDGLELVDEQPSAEREITARQDLEQLYQAIAQLPSKCRQVFILSRVKHMTYPQIARHCGISIKMVEKHIGKALAICLHKVGDGPSRPSNKV